MKAYKAFLIVIVILIIDQITKVWVKTHMFLGEEIPLTSFLTLHFTENPGMAFGMVLPGVWGKLLLSGFRLLAVGGGVWFILRLIKRNEHWGFITATSMILAGAIGNMIDGSFYGLIFTDSYHGLAQSFTGHGYAGFLQGLVVDMIHVRLFNFTLGGTTYEFFPFIFNIADSAITIGVFIIILFQGLFFKEENKADVTTAAENQNPANV
ncbi:MAG: lipoprotein signal peptidase [Chitinophagales bacterium]